MFQWCLKSVFNVPCIKLLKYKKKINLGGAGYYSFYELERHKKYLCMFIDFSKLWGFFFIIILVKNVFFLLRYLNLTPRSNFHYFDIYQWQSYCQILFKFELLQFLFKDCKSNKFSSLKMINYCHFTLYYIRNYLKLPVIIHLVSVCNEKVSWVNNSTNSSNIFKVSYSRSKF